MSTGKQDRWSAIFGGKLTSNRLLFLGSGGVTQEPLRPCRYRRLEGDRDWEEDK